MRRRLVDAEGAGGEVGWQLSEGKGEWWVVRALRKDRRANQATRLWACRQEDGCLRWLRSCGAFVPSMREVGGPFEAGDRARAGAADLARRVAAVDVRD